MLQLSNLFTAEVLAAKFDEQAQEQAAAGRVYAPFVNLLKTAYDLEISATTTTALKKVNVLMSIDAAQKLKTGTGSKVGAVMVWQTLHTWAEALLAGMGTRSRAALAADFKINALPAWACPVAIKAKADKAAAARLAKAQAVDALKLAQATAIAASKPENEDGVEDESDTPITGEAVSKSQLSDALSGAPRDLHAEALAAWAKFAAFIDAGVLTAAERDDFVDMLSKAVTAPEVVTPAVTATRKRAKRESRTAQAQADRESTAKTLATFAKVVAGAGNGAVVGDGDGGGNGDGVGVSDGGDAGNGDGVVVVDAKNGVGSETEAKVLEPAA